MGIRWKVKDRGTGKPWCSRLTVAYWLVGHGDQLWGTPGIRWLRMVRTNYTMTNMTGFPGTQFLIHIQSMAKSLQWRHAQDVHQATRSDDQHIPILQWKSRNLTSATADRSLIGVMQCLQDHKWKSQHQNSLGKVASQCPFQGSHWSGHK